jgi:hypothetical protein
MSINNIDSYLLIVLGAVGILVGCILGRFEWQKYKSGINYGVTNHTKAIFIIIISCIVLLNGIIRILQ